MSDPLTNVEIDDVLSSIRRLVSEQPDRAQTSGPGKLILTPALRVNASDAKAEETADVSDPRHPAPEDRSFDGGENDAPTDPASSRGWTAQVSASDTQTLEQRIAELEQAVAATAEEWEPDGTEPEAGSLPPDMPPVFGAAASPDRPWSGIDRPETHRPETRDAEGSDNETTRSGSIPRDGVASRTGPQDDQGGADDGEPASVFDTESDETVLDEEMLRDLVAEFVREELQGALGERITRNVRKLVRAEIQRALAARDLG